MSRCYTPAAGRRQPGRTARFAVAAAIS